LKKVMAAVNGGKYFDCLNDLYLRTLLNADEN
jgi:hypothetical protein